MIRLLIKGPREDAALALARRDIPILEDLKDADILGFKDTVARVHEAYGGKVRAWFSETPLLPPFPNGTLLYFAETELAELI